MKMILFATQVLSLSDLLSTPKPNLVWFVLLELLLNKVPTAVFNIS